MDRCRAAFGRAHDGRLAHMLSSSSQRALRVLWTRMAFRPALARRRATARADDGKLSRSLALHRRSIARAIGGATHCDVSARGASIVFASAFV